ncbi:hypothetical protein DZA65_01784 [Dickeya dianthicola]|uniref:hypothetical protein n=1 Tax=Dickeya dianthicola TaxID=204039 RepID=UPI0003A02F71|nr:hypothetical protein [Dickeya dianthicola]ATO32710.1 Thioredoxin-like protein [Dickeya dianthicola RNS04.9]AYC18675.1 hypothetical protein DZA65_01784 [Dickeya dianthicola]MBT1427749.1 hypothetical protein [Dickeya dianthicola]MBT1431816.1 hypothetical protein [Dickeya dianthicola]MBT1459262.1 hypothetical protein [Dickeya dianthicola]
MSKILHYVFDPLCGWCYGASPTVAALAYHPAFRLELSPSGLFADEGARSMNDEFAAYAWSNDQRIARLTGQPFSERYRQQVLGDRQQAFDSGGRHQLVRSDAVYSEPQAFIKQLLSA